MNYYVYQYATGFAAASYLAEKIVHGTEEDKEATLLTLRREAQTILWKSSRKLVLI